VMVVELDKSISSPSLSGGNETRPRKNSMREFSEKHKIKIEKLKIFEGCDVYKICKKQVEELLRFCANQDPQFRSPQLNAVHLGIHIIPFHLFYPGIELLTIVIAQTKDFFIKLPHIKSLLTNQFVQILEQYFNTPQIDYSTMMRLGRIQIYFNFVLVKATTQIIVHLKGGYDLVKYILILAENVNFPWKRFLALECLASILISKEQILSLSKIKIPNSTKPVCIFYFIYSLTSNFIFYFR
jgi:hypothetical protein